ncbi:MAG: tryptophan synthase subunit alpha, partial [Gemmatimonadetes bacterium]|nr:tryptophan synthase subunit alpha [Gemmatimonadota bacterium]
MNSSAVSIQECISRNKAAGRGVLIPYLTAGYPDGETSLELMRLVADSGADILELGIPFSDPLADGPTIQRSSFRALEGGMTVDGALELLRRFRASHDIPVVLFTYLNPILQYGIPRFLRAAVEAGAQGLLLTDLPSGADPDLEAQIISSDLDLIRLLAPTTGRERIKAVAEGGSGFIYFISRTGVTGAQQDLRSDLGREVQIIREEVDLPIAIGFGISTPDQAASVAGVCEGVVVGSA